MGRVVRVPCSGGKLRTKPTQGGLAAQGRAVRCNKSSSTKRCGQRWTSHDALCVEIPTWAACFRLPTSRMTRTEAQPFRILLCRRLQFSLPLSLRSCRCGSQLDSFGHHRAACHVAGVLGRRRGCFGMRCCTDVSRSRGTGHDQHVCSRHGPGPLQRTRRSKTRGCGQTGSHSGAGHSWPLIPPVFSC